MSSSPTGSGTISPSMASMDALIACDVEVDDLLHSPNDTDESNEAIDSSSPSPFKSKENDNDTSPILMDKSSNSNSDSTDGSQESLVHIREHEVEHEHEHEHGQILNSPGTKSIASFASKDYEKIDELDLGDAAASTSR